EAAVSLSTGALCTLSSGATASLLWALGWHPIAPNEPTIIVTATRILPLSFMTIRPSVFGEEQEQRAGQPGGTAQPHDFRGISRSARARRRNARGVTAPRASARAIGQKPKPPRRSRWPTRAGAEKKNGRAPHREQRWSARPRGRDRPD